MKKRYAKLHRADGSVQRIGSRIADPTTYNTLRNLEAPIDEIDALACLISVAGKVRRQGSTEGASPDLYGYDMELLYEIVVRCIRKLARACQDAHARWQIDSPADPVVEYIDPDDAP